MLNHSKSLFLSLLVHALILLSLLGIYKYAVLPAAFVEEEKRVCVNLRCVKQQTEETHKKQKERKKVISEKKAKKIPQHKKVIPPKKQKTQEKPKKIKKKIPLKKEIKKKKETIKETKTEEKTKPEKRIEKPSEEKPEKKVEEVVKNMPVAEENLRREKSIKKSAEKKVSEKEAYLQENLAQIAQLIKENLYYPRMARKRGIQGSVTVRFMLLKDATVVQITTISSSSGILTRAAIKTIAELSGKFPKPKTDMMLSVPIRYSLQ
ncbi:TonB family protein [Sulfurimonas sp. SWIR-19]|uniref:energy transducer TonB n=1 Tax=Sulfurimonas sp. SWIR-19 TaxID=2878390 RepID=UPI001CF46688|nr:energy transducer TonB [Sulfurimonas sp. SWIR-19]UCN01003.1 TonB family protein [Sulfurimonas sp. SWIR-19]